MSHELKQGDRIVSIPHDDREGTIIEQQVATVNGKTYRGFLVKVDGFDIPCFLSTEDMKVVPR